MKSPLITCALTLASAVVAQAGFIVGNTGFTIYTDVNAWLLTHPNALPVSLSGTATGQYSTNLTSGAFAITGYQLSLGQIGNSDALIADTSHGIGVGFTIAQSLSVTSLGFYVTPLPYPASYWTQIIVDAGPGQLDYYESLNAPFFFGVDSPSRIDYVHLDIGLGSTVTALALDSLQTDTPELATVTLLALPFLLLVASRQRRFRSSHPCSSP